jgi:hypothetical protein
MGLTNYITASSLFGGFSDEGDKRCYYCGACCSGNFTAKKYVKPTFTNRDIVKFPSSQFVCKNCVDSMESKYPKIKLADGEERENQRVRQYCWVLTKDEKIAATKAHISFLRDTILNPPEPPFVICLADSGQKQILFRAPVAMDRDVFDVILEDDYISVDREELKQLLDLCKPLVAAIGKVAIISDFTMSTYIKVEEYFGSLDYLEKWEKHKNKPLAKLAAWLSVNQKEAQVEYQNIKRKKIQTKNSRVSRPKETDSRNGSQCDDVGSGQLCFDLA